MTLISEFKIIDGRPMAEYTRDSFMYGRSFAQYYHTIRMMREVEPRLFDLTMGDYVREQMHGVLQQTMPAIIEKVKRGEL